MPIGHFLLVVLWTQASISNAFRDNQRRMWCNGWHDLNTASKQRSRSLILVQVDFSYITSYWLSIVTFWRFALGRTPISHSTYDTYITDDRQRRQIIIIPGQCLWCCHHAVAALREFTLVHAQSAARRQVAANLWTKPIGLNHKPACRLPVNYTHRRHFIITQPESWYSLYHPTEGRVDLVSWLHTEMVYPLAHSHPSKYWPGPA